MIVLAHGKSGNRGREEGGGGGKGTKRDDSMLDRRHPPPPPPPSASQGTRRHKTAEGMTLKRPNGDA